MTRAIHSTEDLKNMFLESFYKIDSMPVKYFITLNPYVLLVQHGSCRVPIEAKEEIETKLKEMTPQDIITLQVEPTPWVSSYICLQD